MLCPSSLPASTHVSQLRRGVPAVVSARGDTEGFSVHGAREGPLHRLTPVGELDLATAPILEREFHVVHPDQTVEMVVVDLTRLTFMDSSGINLIARLNTLCERNDRLRVINGSPAAQRAIDLSGIRDHLPIISKGDDPLAPLGRGLQALDADVRNRADPR